MSARREFTDERRGETLAGGRSNFFGKGKSYKKRLNANLKLGRNCEVRQVISNILSQHHSHAHAPSGEPCDFQRSH